MTRHLWHRLNHQSRHQPSRFTAHYMRQVWHPCSEWVTDLSRLLCFASHQNNSKFKWKSPWLAFSILGESQDRLCKSRLGWSPPTTTFALPTRVKRENMLPLSPPPNDQTVRPSLDKAIVCELPQETSPTLLISFTKVGMFRLLLSPCPWGKKKEYGYFNGFLLIVSCNYINSSYKHCLELIK